MLLIDSSRIRLMPRHIDKSVINIFLIHNFLRVDFRVFKSFRRRYTTLAFWGIAARIPYKVHRAPYAFAFTSSLVTRETLKRAFKRLNGTRFNTVRYGT